MFLKKENSKHTLCSKYELHPVKLGCVYQEYEKCNTQNHTINIFHWISNLFNYLRIASY